MRAVWHSAVHPIVFEHVIFDGPSHVRRSVAVPMHACVTHIAHCLRAAGWLSINIGQQSGEMQLCVMEELVELHRGEMVNAL